MKQILPLLLLMGCAGVSLTSVSLIDQHGFNETITNRDRLSSLEKVDFRAPQPYRKALRIYSRGDDGNARSVVTSYHPNGQLHQSLELLNGRAFGCYEEYFLNSQRKLLAQVVAGNADLDPDALRSFVFDGESQAWDENGNLIASICYNKGELDGVSHYFYPSGKLEGRVPFLRGKQEGNEEHFFEDGTVRSQIPFKSGLRDGTARSFWPDRSLASQEQYREGLLICGDYFDVEGSEIACVRDGFGWCAESSMVLREYRGGIPEGQIKEYSDRGELIHSYGMVDGLKEGEEIEYYSPDVSKLSVSWHKGEIEGEVKSWYPDGQMESHREMVHNKKECASTAWYADGSLMMIEEYCDDKLVRGEYFSKGSCRPISRVNGGRGTATLFDADGRLLRKVNYADGAPLV